MESRLYLDIGAILLLILANGFFALAEFSIIASRKSRLIQKLDEGKAGAAAAIRLHDTPESFLATIQVGLTLMGSLIGVVSGATIVTHFEQYLSTCGVDLLQHWAGPVAVVSVVVSITILSVVVGELVPKYIALSHPERYARLVARPILVFINITFVFSRLLGGLANGVLHLLGIRKGLSSQAVSEDEINHMIFEGREKGLFDVTEEEFVKSVFQFTDTAVRRAMRPRPDVIAINVDAPAHESMRLIVENGYSRYPVYRGSIDTIVGLIYVKDLIKDGVDAGHVELSKVMRQPLFVPDTMPLTKLLREFQAGKNHLAIVLDEYGGTAGIITLEDILEELVGEIQDEYDSEAPPVVKFSESVVYANGTVWPGEINEVLGCRLPEEQSDTLAGLFVDTVGHMPEKYETVMIGDVRLTILAKDRHRVIRLKLERIAAETTDD